ncbi:MAG: hypothetical protein M3R00_08560, partial [Pseudomonadota bacterium]|nr:hypothetical protein [Pseudomonadota bacterium]
MVSRDDSWCQSAGYFFKPKHRKLFTVILKPISGVYKVDIHAYCLMTNQYHILLRTMEANLPALMKYLD